MLRYALGDLPHALASVRKTVGHLAGHRDRVAGARCFGPGREHKAHRMVQVLQALPQWAGVLYHVEHVAALQEAGLQVRAADVPADHPRGARFDTGRHRDTLQTSTMNVIPVIDLLHGQVVRAVRGDRSQYRPIVSPLCASSEPLAVSRILCQHCASARLYVADLDALQGGVSQIATLRALLAADPRLELWLDAGFADVGAAADVLSALAPHSARVVPVFGSESLRSRGALAACFSAGRPPTACCRSTAATAAASTLPAAGTRPHCGRSG